LLASGIEGVDTLFSKTSTTQTSKNNRKQNMIQIRCYPSGAAELSPVFSGVRVVQSFLLSSQDAGLRIYGKFIHFVKHPTRTHISKGDFN
jgi:hypothetical protein